MNHPLKRPSCPPSLKRTALVLGAVLAATALPGCGRAHHGHGHVYVPPQPDVFVELEPNDTPDFPDFVSVLDDLSYLVVEGHVEAVGTDIVDHIEFESDRPMEVDFTLEAFGAFGDVDVIIYDPIADEVVGVYATGGAYEVGTLVIHEAGRPFQFIIEAFDTDSPWSLEIETYPHNCACRTGEVPENETGSLNVADPERSANDSALPAFVAKREHEMLRPRIETASAIDGADADV